MQILWDCQFVLSHINTQQNSPLNYLLDQASFDNTWILVCHQYTSFAYSKRVIFETILSIAPQNQDTAQKQKILTSRLF